VAKRRIGVDIGSTAARAAEIAFGSSGPALIRAAQVPLPAGAVENGEVRQPELVGEALKELWTRGGFKTKQVVLGVGNQRVVVREVALPWLPEKELRDSLAYQVQEFIPMSADEAVLDFDPLGEFEEDGRRMLRLLLVAAQRVMVSTVVEATDHAGLQPIGLDLVPLALVRAVGTYGEGLEDEARGDEAVIDVGAHVTSVCVHDNGLTRFVRILPLGGRNVTLAVSTALKLSEEDAELLKRGEDVPDGPSPGEVRKVAIDRAAGLVDEIRSSLEFYSAQAPGAKVDRVVITGGGSKLDGFFDLIGERIPLPIEHGRALGRVESRLALSAEALEEADWALPVAVGLAIPGRGR
jgi:type IV pilus assembly protein PilM